MLSSQYCCSNWSIGLASMPQPLAERLWFWKRGRTTGIMQVASPGALTDVESVDRGAQKLLASWQAHTDKEAFPRTFSTIADYNKDETNVGRVIEVMEILAKRAAPQFRPAFEAIFSE